jgi:hypothetical protein
VNALTTDGNHERLTHRALDDVHRVEEMGSAASLPRLIVHLANRWIEAERVGGRSEGAKTGSLPRGALPATG